MSDQGFQPVDCPAEVTVGGRTIRCERRHLRRAAPHTAHEYERDARAAGGKAVTIVVRWTDPDPFAERP